MSAYRKYLDEADAIVQRRERRGHWVRGEQEAIQDLIAKASHDRRTRARVDEVGKSIRLEDTAGESPGAVLAKSIMSTPRGEAGWTTGPVELKGKALLTTLGTGADTAGGALIMPDAQPGIVEKLFQRLTVADLMGSGSTNSNLVRSMTETLATNAAAGVVEGAAKPESSLEFAAVDEPVKKIATFLPISDEMLEDVASLQSYINARLSLFVRIEEERQLLNGAGGTAELTGLVSRIPAANKGLRKAGANVTDADHIFRGISRVREANLEPDGIVIHPNDWEGIVLQKDTALNYMGGGPFTGEAGKSLWGLRVVVTNAVAEAVPIIGAFGTAAKVFRRGGVTVEASNSHASYFVSNLTAVRAEERIAFACLRPEAFVTCDLGTAGVAT